MLKGNLFPKQNRFIKKQAGKNKGKNLKKSHNELKFNCPFDIKPLIRIINKNHWGSRKKHLKH